MKAQVAFLILALAPMVPAQERIRPPVDEDYNQWKQALGTNRATPAGQLTALPGFSVELLHSAAPGEGSWVALACDPRGRLVMAREDRGLLRLTLSTNGAAPVRLEVLNTNLLECRGLLFAYDALYANANNSKGLYRLRDTDGDDQFDEVTLLRATPGGVGHGRNQLALGPDGMIYSIHGDDVGLQGVAPDSPFRHNADDQLLPCEWDKHLSNAGARMPFGHLIRTDRNGRTWELVAGGLRNPFGIDFNEAGDLFTYDADMEWDVGLSWYHPTRVLHLVPGGDYGWRRGTAVLPAWSPDTLPSVVDIGLGSPTAIKFATKSTFPDPWRQALFLLDWAYGKILAVHLQRAGASYTGRTEEFLKGRPLNVTGLDFGADGAMYFITGGRRTQSGLYRVRWTGPRSRLNPAIATHSREGRGEGETRNVKDSHGLWQDLNADDRWVRYAARLKLEAQSPREWRDRALAESSPMAGLTALLALARTDDTSEQPALLRRLRELSENAVTVDQQLLAIRALGLCALRMGRPDRSVMDAFATFWESRYPGADARVNQALCELLVYLESTNVVRRTLPLLATAATQEEKMHYLHTLRLVTNGWSLEQRLLYFNWLGRARHEFEGANMLPTALGYIRADAEKTLTAVERAALAPALAALDQPRTAPPPSLIARSFVKEWRMSDFAEVPARGTRYDPVRGRRLFAETGCATCHRMGREGGMIGPDLTAVASRFDRRALLESIVEPSKVVAEVYRNVALTMKTGAVVEGRILAEDTGSLTLATHPVEPERHQRILKTDIAAQRLSEISPMPEGLLNTLTKEEILDLLSWIESGAIGAP